MHVEFSDVRAALDMPEKSSEKVDLSSVGGLPPCAQGQSILCTRAAPTYSHQRDKGMARNRVGTATLHDSRLFLIENILFSA